MNSGEGEVARLISEHILSYLSYLIKCLIICISSYLIIAVNSGEGEVARLIQRERECLRPDQFFDVDMVPLIIIMMMGIEHEMCTMCKVDMLLL